MEGLASEYWEMLQNSSAPVKVLTGFYSKLNGVPPTPKIAGALGKLTKLYGRSEVYKAIISIYDYGNVNYSEPPYGLLNHNILSRLTRSESAQSSVDRTSDIDGILNQIKKVKEANN